MIAFAVGVGYFAVWSRGNTVGLTEDIAKGRCASFYLVISQEEYLRVDATRRWLAALEQSGPQTTYRFRPPRWDLTELENVLLTLPMFGDAVAVIIHDIEKTHPAHQERLVSLLKVRGPHVSVLATASSIDKRRKFSRALIAMGSVEEFGRVYAEQRPGWVHRIAGDLGWSISNEAAAAIAELVGEDLMAYEAELKKIILYVGEKRRIEKQDVDIVLFADSRFGDFAIADAFGRRDLARALRVIRQLYSGSGAKGGWMPLMGGTLFRFLRVKSLVDKLSDREIAAELGLNPYVARLLRPQVGMYSRAELLRGIDLLYEAERDIKTSVLPPALAAEFFLVRLIFNQTMRQTKSGSSVNNQESAK
jgi:DNA polymerase-3 subunit delta